MIKKLIFGLLAIPLIGVAAYFVMNASPMDFESVCLDKKNKKYNEELCSNVGKRAVSQQSIINVTDKDYGQIIGVAWRKKGSQISSQNQKQKRVSENNAYYYIISDDKRKNQFLRAVSETDTR